MTNTDPGLNVVVFELVLRGTTRRLSTTGAAHAADGVKVGWSAVASETGAHPAEVRRIYSEWEPSSEDLAFIESTFPDAAVTYSFSRPRDGDWETALRNAELVIRGTEHSTGSPEQRGEDATVGRRGTRRWWQFWR